MIVLAIEAKRPAITKHLSNIYKSDELGKESTCSILEHMTEHGQLYRTKHYNLDAIISVGYRVSSIRATQVLKDHLVQGYDKQQLAEVGIKQLDMQPLELDEALQAIGAL